MIHTQRIDGTVGELIAFLRSQPETARMTLEVPVKSTANTGSSVSRLSFEYEGTVPILRRGAGDPPVTLEHIRQLQDELDREDLEACFPSRM